MGRVAEIVAEELDFPRSSLGATTLNRQGRVCGLGPDESYYLANVGRIGDQLRVDLEVDPPPNLAVEISIVEGSLDRLGIRLLWDIDKPLKQASGQMYIHNNISDCLC